MAITWQATGVGALKDALEGGHRTNKFMVSLLPPDVLSLSEDEITNTALLVKDISFPQTQLTTSEIWYQGEKIIVPTNIDKTYTLDMTFYNDASLKSRGIFEKWIESMNSNINLFSEHKGSIIVKSLKGGYGLAGSLGALAESFIPSGSKTHAYDEGTEIWYNEIFPTSVSALELSLESGNQVSTTTVTLSFRTSTRSGVADSTDGGLLDFLGF